MRYRKGDAVTLKQNYTMSPGNVIPKGTQGIVFRVISIANGYIVTFDGYGNVLVHDTFLV